MNFDIISYQIWLTAESLQLCTKVTDNDDDADHVKSKNMYFS